MKDSRRPALRILALATTVGMFAVLVSGSNVTNTGSEQGCGRSWPLCHGQLIPQFAVSTAIEFTHRAMVGFETVLILALAAGTLLFYRRRLEARILVTLMVLFLFLQAGLGAWAVMYPQEAGILALHFGVSLIAFSSVLLTTLFLFDADRVQTLPRPPRAYSWYAWGLTAFSYLVVYLGAYVRHAGASLGCGTWPLCNGQLLPHLIGSQGPAFIHRGAAGLFTLGVILLVLWSWQLHGRRDLRTASLWAGLTVLLQVASGALVVFTHLDLFSALAHAGLAGLLFGSLTYVCMRVLPPSRPAEIGDHQVSPVPAPLGAGRSSI